MRKTLLIGIATLTTIYTSAQDFPGYRTGNYSGVNGVFVNPANIADSRYYFDVNLFSMSIMGANNQASYKMKDFARFKSENLRDKLFGEDPGRASGLFSLDVHGPSGMLAVGKKSTLALTTRARLFANVIDFDTKLFDQITNASAADPSLPYTINSADNMRFSFNGWTEYGFTFSRILTDKGAHALKGGVSVKYLSGAANGYINVNRFNGTIRADQITQTAFLENASGAISSSFAGERVSGFEPGRLLKHHGYGFGADLGLVYEYRPDGSMQTTDGIRLSGNDKELYKFKLGVSVIDLGSILYKRDPEKSGNYGIDINNGEAIYLSEFNNTDVDDFNEFFQQRPQYFVEENGQTENEYSVSLPSTLQIEADYLLNDGFYLNLSSQISLSNSKTKYFNNRAYSGVTFTPRYEDKLIGIYLPVNYNSLTKFNAGISFRVGPLFFGSGSVLTAIFGSSRQADVQIGLRLGELIL